MLEKKGPSSLPTIVWFHGNGELVDGLISLGERFSSKGYGFAMMEYRGYGRSAALEPSEAGIYDDADALLAALEHDRAVTDGAHVLVGYSLGSAIAAEMAVRGHGDAVVLISPFTSIRAMGKRLVPILPIDLLMTERYDTLTKAPQIHQPCLVVHGTADELVPFAMGEAVAAAIPKVVFLPIEGGHHADMVGPASEGAFAGVTELADRAYRTR